MKIIEPNVKHPINSVIEGEGVQHYQKLYHEVAYLYKKPRTDDPIVYEVYSYTQGENRLGHLNWGLTILKPILSYAECNMTKGHFHMNQDCAEIYYGIAGEGLLLLMDETGYTWAQRITEGSLHYIDGHLAHRIVNTGDCDLKVGACWPTVAGHDYDAIKEREFGYRIFKNNSQIEYMKR